MSTASPLDKLSTPVLDQRYKDSEVTQADTDADKISDTTAKFRVPGLVEGVIVPYIICFVLNLVICRYVMQSTIGMASLWIRTMGMAAFLSNMFSFLTTPIFAFCLRWKSEEKTLIEIGCNPAIYSLPTIWCSISITASIVACIVYAVNWFQLPAGGEPTAPHPGSVSAEFAQVVGLLITMLEMCILVCSFAYTMGFREAIRLVEATHPSRPTGSDQV